MRPPDASVRDRILHARIHPERDRGVDDGTGDAEAMQDAQGVAEPPVRLDQSRPTGGDPVKLDAGSVFPAQVVLSKQTLEAARRHELQMIEVPDEPTLPLQA